MQPDDTDAAVVAAVKSNVYTLREGGEVDVQHDGDIEFWREITHKHYKQHQFDTCYFAISSHGRAMTNSGKITDSGTASRMGGGYPV